MLKPTPDSNADAIGLGAFLAPGAASFGPIEAITLAGNITPAFSRDDAPLAVWSAAPDPAGVPGTHPGRVVRTSTRTS